MEQRPRRTASRWVAAGVTAAALVPLAACGHHTASPPAPPSASPASSPVAAAPPMKVSFRSVTGRLPKADRQRLAAEMQSIVERWWAAAYLNDRPSKSFPAFTPAAAKLAEQRAGLMTSSVAQGTSIAVVRRTLAIDVLAVKKNPVGVDAVTDLTYAVGSGAHPTKYRVHGTIALRPSKQRWRVFAFDLTKYRLDAASKQPAKPKHAAKHTSKNGGGR